MSGAKAITAMVYEGHTRLLSCNPAHTERALLRQDASLWSAPVTTGRAGEGGVPLNRSFVHRLFVSAPFVQGPTRVLLSLIGETQLTSINLKNNGTAFITIRAASREQMAAFCAVETSGVGSEVDRRIERLFDEWPVLVPSTQLCSAEHLKFRVANKINKPKLFKTFSRFNPNVNRSFTPPLLRSLHTHTHTLLQRTCQTQLVHGVELIL